MNHSAIGRNGQEIYSAKPTHPGVVLGEELEARQLKPSSFAESIGQHPTFITEVIKGHRPMSAVLALNLENTLAISAGFWMRLQVNYDLNVERFHAGTP